MNYHLKKKEDNHKTTAISYFNNEEYMYLLFKK